MANTRKLIAQAYSAVHQLVKSLSGEVLSDSEVWHVHTIVNGLIERMDLKASEGSSASSPSAAFATHLHG